MDDKDQPADRRISGETVMTNLRVIAVDQQLVQGGQGTQANPGAAGNSNRTVTLEASSYDAARIAIASRLGRLALVVRSAADDQPAADSDVAGSAPVAPPEQAPIAWSGDVSPALREHGGKAATTIRVHHGAKEVEEVKF